MARPPENVARPPGVETTTLQSYLDAQRHHVFEALDGLDEASLQRPVLPSGWTCLGLVNHLAVDVERFWFRGVIAAEQPVIDQLSTSQDNAWKVGSDIPATTVLDLYRQEAARADVVISSAPLDASPAWWPDFFGDWRLDDCRHVILHVIAETACHAGHLDSVRELLDGKQWVVLTE
jgi:hypothetical protein